MNVSDKNWNGLAAAIDGGSASDGAASSIMSYAQALEILRLIDSTPNISKLSLSFGEIHLEVERGGNARDREMSSQPALRTAAMPQTAPAVQPASPPSAHKESATAPSGATAVRTPIAGIFYCSPAPGEPAFVEVGDTVEEDTIVGIVEVMKVMNNIRAGTRGVVVDIFVENEQLVQFDQAVIHVEPSA